MKIQGKNAEHSAKGRSPKLEGAALQSIYRLIVDSDPRHVEFSVALWNRGMVRELIDRECDVQLSDVSIARLLDKIGLIRQRGRSRTRQHKAKLVVQWITEDLPAIKKLANQEGADIFFGNITSVLSAYHSGANENFTGPAPATKSSGERAKVGLITAIDKKGKSWFMATEKTITADIFCQFLDRLIANATAPVFLVVDNRAVCHSLKVREFVNKANGMLRLIYSHLV